MKKVIISSLVLFASSAQADQPIPGAAYAVITGAKGGKLVITKGANSREHGFSDFMNAISSGIEYYNWRGEVVPYVGKKLANLEELDLSSPNVSTDSYERNVDKIRASLSDLPEVRSVKLMLSNTDSGRQSIQLFDKDGHLIRSSTFARWGSFKIGSPLPQAAIEELQDWVRNPAELSLLGINEIRER